MATSQKRQQIRGATLGVNMMKGRSKNRIPTDPHKMVSFVSKHPFWGNIYIRVFSHSQMLRYKHLSKLVVLLNFVAHKTSSRLAYFVSIKFVQTTTVLICRANWASAAMALVHLHSDMEDAGVWSPDNVRLSFLHGNPMLKYVTFSVFGQIHLDIYIYLDSITLQKEKNRYSHHHSNELCLCDQAPYPILESTFSMVGPTGKLISTLYVDLCLIWGGPLGYGPKVDIIAEEINNNYCNKHTNQKVHQSLLFF